MCVFPTIDLAMRNGRITVKMIADLIETTENEVLQKLKGKEKISVDEAITIKDEFFPGISLEQLFKSKSQK